MSRFPFLLAIAAVAAFAADDPWTKVKDIKSGTELRIFRKGVAQPVLAKMDEANDERILIVVKNEQLSIPKAQIDHLDARPVQKASRVTSNSSSKTTDPDTSPGPPGHGSRTPQTNYSSGLSVGSKPDFETVYRAR